MKTYLLTLVSLLALLQNCYSQTEKNSKHAFPGIDNWENVIAKATAENKYIMVDLSTEWCSWCKVMDKKHFTDPEILSLMQPKLNSYMLDAEKDSIGQLLKLKFGVAAYPSFLFFTPQGEYLETWCGAMPKEYWMQYIKDSIDLVPISRPGIPSGLKFQWPDFVEKEIKANFKKSTPNQAELNKFFAKCDYKQFVDFNVCRFYPRDIPDDLLNTMLLDKKWLDANYGADIATDFLQMSINWKAYAQIQDSNWIKAWSYMNQYKKHFPQNEWELFNVKLFYYTSKVEVDSFFNERFDSIAEAKEFVEDNDMTLVRVVEAEDEPEYKTEDVEHIDTDVQFIKRYAAMHGKVKSQAQVLNLIHSLQKAIIEKKIGKDSGYAKEIELMQKQLITCYEKMGEMAEIKIDSKNLKRYLEIAHSQEGMLSVSLLKAYVSLNGKRDVKDKAERLFNRMKKAVEQGKISRNDKYAEKLNEAYTTLKTYIDGETAILNINKAQLNGLLGILGEDLFSQKKSLNGYDDDEQGMIVSSGELLSMDFQTIGLQGKYRELIGDPSVGFTAMVYGLPKSGKSTMCLDFANYLAAHHGKVLYCAIEEGFGYTLKEKIQRLGAQHSNLFITDRVPENLSDFNFVFIDSVSKAGMDVNAIDQLRKIHPDTSFIFIYHTTKEGNFKGVNEHAHEVDVIIQVEKGKASSTGRFSAGGSLNINE